MEHRYFTKALWAAVIVIMAIGALGQDVLAEKKQQSRELSSIFLVCGPKGIVEEDVTTKITVQDNQSPPVIETKQDTHTGRSCFSIVRKVAIAAAGVDGYHNILISFQFGPIDDGGAWFKIEYEGDISDA